MVQPAANHGAFAEMKDRIFMLLTDHGLQIGSREFGTDAVATLKIIRYEKA